MKTSTLLLVYLIMQMSVHMQAQTLKGVVSDAENNKLSWANVAVFNDNGELVTGCATKEDGTFSIDIPNEIKSCKLITSFVGMKSDTLYISKFPGSKISGRCECCY